jgi:tripartite-type tricarboxylate transporter receptor subunit TctC
MIVPRRRFLHLAASAAVLPALARTVAAQSYPMRPIKLINALAAGSAPDILSRIIAEPLSRGLGLQVIVENRPGAANIIAAQAAARAAPDGYMLFFGPSLALAVNPIRARPARQMGRDRPRNRHRAGVTLSRGQLRLRASAPATRCVQFSPSTRV